MKLTRWVMTYIVMASVGLWVAFFMSLRFMTPAHTQSAPAANDPQKVEAPMSGDLPPEFLEGQNGTPAANQKIPPPPSLPPIPPPPQAAPTSPEPGPVTNGTPSAAPSTLSEGDPSASQTEESPIPVMPQFASDDQYTYDPTGHRDPFKPYKSYRPPTTTTTTSPTKIIDPSDPLQRWELDRFSVVAIMWEVRLPKAMVKDPDGKVYMISKNSKIGRNSGQVVAIREGEVVVVEAIETEGVQTKEVKILELKK